MPNNNIGCFRIHLVMVKKEALEVVTTNQNREC